jgi:RNA polymerase sigma-70 factor (family 1)
MVHPHAVHADDGLIARIRAGDGSAFEAIVRDHYNGLCIFAARLTGSDAAAEEIVQDVLLRIWQRHERWEVAGSIASYLYTAVRNRALNTLRDERHHRQWQKEIASEMALLDGDGARGRPDAGVRSAELARAIDQAIQALPPRCRQAFLLRRQHHLSYAEIARVMGITPKTVEIQIGIALKALRKKLADWL